MTLKKVTHILPKVMFELHWDRQVTSLVDGKKLLGIWVIDNPETIFAASRPTAEVAYVQVIDGRVVQGFREDEISIQDVEVSL